MAVGNLNILSCPLPLTSGKKTRAKGGVVDSEKGGEGANFNIFIGAHFRDS